MHVDGDNDGVGYGVRGVNTTPASLGHLHEAGVVGTSQGGVGVFGTSGDIASLGIFGSADIGVQGASPVGTGVAGHSRIGRGVVGDSDASDGVRGVSNSGTGVFGQGKNGVHGVSASATDSGVWGENTQKGYGVSGSTNSDFVLGPGVTAGVWGNNAGSGAGVKGISQGGDGVVGFSNSSAHAALSGTNTGGGFAVWAKGKTAGHFETDGSNGAKAIEAVASGTQGVGVGSTGDSAGVLGTGNATGVFGNANASQGFGVYGSGIPNPNDPANGGIGVFGYGGAFGVAGLLNDPGSPLPPGQPVSPDPLYRGGAGVYGECHGGTNQNAIIGYSTGHGSGAIGVAGVGGGNSLCGVMALAKGGTGLIASGDAGNGKAGLFYGSVQIKGMLTKSGGGFRIDHPLDSETRYLQHSFGESPDMMNVYCGTAILNGSGEAEVQLPDWFEALNRDFRYQLTCVGKYAPVFISKEIKHNKFVISGGAPDVKVCWQVTGIRHDRYAEQHRLAVEVEKDSEMEPSLESLGSPK